MDDEDEVERIVFLYAIENEHGLHGEMPRASTVGCGHDNGYAANDEGDQRTGHAQLGCRLEAEECQVVMQEVASPDGEGEEQKQWHVAHLAKRGDALPDTGERVLHLIIYGELAQENPEEDAHGNEADDGDHPPRAGEAVDDAVETGARLVEERHEDGNLHEERSTGNQQDEHRVDGTLGDNGSQGLGERNVVVAFQYPAARKLAEAGHDETQGIGEEDGVDGSRDPRTFPQRLQRLTPAPATEHLRHDAKGEGQQHPCPVHLVKHHLLDLLEVEPSVHPVEDGTTENHRQQYLQYVVGNCLHIMQK